MWNRKIATAAVLAAGCGAVAIACGPFFPWELLDDRAQTLKATPVNSFTFEVSHLAPHPADTLKPVENFDYAWASQMQDQQAENAARERWDAESAGLSANEIILLRAARAAANGPEALKQGDGLPLAILHYTAGAVAWHKGDDGFAKAQFDTVLRLAEKDRKPRAVWAAYMLGRIAAKTRDETGVGAFRQARAMAQKGAADPLGLAVASYGEEARVHLKAAEALLQAGDMTTVTEPPDGQRAPDSEANKYRGSALPDPQAGPFREEIAKAVSLYAEQAARGSGNGVQSLRIVAEFLLDRSDRITAVAGEPHVQRLMVAYALRLAENNTYDISHDGGYGFPNTIQLGTQLSAERERDLFADLIAVLKKQPRPAGADRIAALCYNRGDWACAADFAKKSGSPLAAWVEAKLATQKGDLAGAAKFYAQAVHGFPTTTSLEEDGRRLVLGESGVVALARGDYVDALGKLWPVSATYWGDVAYLSERVLTADELRAFVDAHVPPGTAGSRSEPYATPFNSRVALRDLLARRLMREKRYDEAFAYFSADKTREAAKAYAAALKRADRSWGKVGRAEALFEAATIARQSGLEIMGTEGPPDSYYTQGDFEGGIGRNSLKGPFITTGERNRFAASRVAPDQRFHYRYVAIGEANAAADLVPEKSQAFAAMLCHATAWSSRDPARANALWLRYVRHGARVPFATTFGVNCPAPDFKGAIQMERKLMIRQARTYVSRNRWWFAGGGTAGLAAIAGLVTFLLLRKRRSA